MVRPSAFAALRLMIRFRASLPKTLIGKPSRKALVEEEGARRKAAPADGAPRG